MMKTIVCYGDSNTWGYMPKTESPAITANNRYPWGVRWTSLLQMKLGADYRVAEAGLNGRTTVYPHYCKPWQTGIGSLEAVLYSQKPLDLIVMMLGTNDLLEGADAAAAADRMDTTRN